MDVQSSNRCHEHDLNVGLAEAFGRLKAKEAIPFLIKNITLKRGALDDTPNLVEGSRGDREATARRGRAHTDRA